MWCWRSCVNVRSTVRAYWLCRSKKVKSSGSCILVATQRHSPGEGEGKALWDYKLEPYERETCEMRDVRCEMWDGYELEPLEQEIDWEPAVGTFISARNHTDLAPVHHCREQQGTKISIKGHVKIGKWWELESDEESPQRRMSRTTIQTLHLWTTAEDSKIKETSANNSATVRESCWENKGPSTAVSPKHDRFLHSL